MKHLKKYNAFLEATLAEPATKPSTTPAPATPTTEPGTKPGKRERPTPIRRDRPAVEPDPQAKMKMDATEEEGTYIGAEMLQNLADALGTEVMDNAVEYEGKKVNFYSETEKFHVDKKKFNTVEEVVEYLTGGKFNKQEIQKTETDLDEISDEVKQLEEKKRIIENFEEFNNEEENSFTDDFEEFEDELEDEEDFDDFSEDEFDEEEKEMARRFMEEDSDEFQDGFDDEKNEIEGEDNGDTDEESWIGNNHMEDDDCSTCNDGGYMESHITKRFKEFNEGKWLDFKKTFSFDTTYTSKQDIWNSINDAVHKKCR